jgi:glycosyltransferase involved in cell wall biosynthesis
MKQAPPIRILQIIARMNVGGPALIVAELMRGLDTAKFQVILVTGYCADNEADYLDGVASDIPAIRLHGLGRSVSLFGDMKAFIKLLKLIRKLRPDIIHTHTAKAGVLGRVAGLIAYPKAKRIHTFHGHLLQGYFSRSKTNLVVLSEKFLASISTTLIAIGNQVKYDLLAAGVGNPKQYSVVFPGLKDLDFQNKESARNQLDLELDKIYIVFMGRLTQIKRPDRLIEIARHLKAKHPKIELLIAGAGDKFAKVQEIAIRESLPMTLLGWRHDIGKILSAGDVVILCSDNEGIPLTLIQASQAGLPIISTDVGSVNDIVIDGKTGLLTEANAQSLIHAVDELTSDPVKMEQFGRAGKLRAESLFSLSGMIQAHEQLYSQVITTKS